MKKILFLDPDDASFIIQRLVMVRAAQKAGFEVHVAAPDTGFAAKIKELGMIFHPLDLNRGGMNPVLDIKPFIQLVILLLRLKPGILHNISIKPVIYGTLAARITRINGVVNLINGLGYSFDGIGVKGKIIRKIVKFLYKISLSYRPIRVIFQNPDDKSLFEIEKIVSTKKTVLIRGSGVDTSKFPFMPLPSLGVPKMVFIGRLLWSKGIGELVSATKMLKAEKIAFELIVIGEPDERNPDSVTTEQIKKWQEEGLLEWRGKQVDMPKIYAEMDVVCLPSYYREGLPLTLLEGASCGRPLIAADSPGTREPIQDGVNGLLVAPRDDASLAQSMKIILNDRELRREMGIASRDYVDREFSSEIISRRIIEVYNSF